MTEWIPVIATLAGALIGGIISYLATVATLIKQEKGEKRAIILSKLEETHQVARSIRQTYIETYGDMVQHLVTGVRPPQDELEHPLEIDRLAMLVGFYFPELASRVDTLESSRGKFGATLAECMTATVKPRRPKEELLAEFHQRYQHLDKTCRELLYAIAATARKKIKL